jgi:transposase
VKIKPLSAVEVSMPTSDEDLLRLPPRDLVAIIRQLEQRVSALERALRDTFSSKAPFSKGCPKPKPKKPGRRAGQGTFTRRAEPLPTPADEVQNIDVPLAVDQRLCPKCDTALVTTNELATVEDTPTQPKRVIKRFTVEIGRCPVCGLTVRGDHPELGAHQCGANAHQVGHQVIAQALALHYHSGLPLRRVPGVIAETTGITLTQSALSQTAIAMCHGTGGMQKHYVELREQIAQSPTVNTDDTGWRIGGKLAFLMGFFTVTVAFFQVRLRHRHQEVMEVLGTSFAGMLGTDRGSSYEAEAFAAVEMQKCLSHILKNLSSVEETKTGRAKSFTTRLKATLREGIALWQTQREGKIDRAEYLRQGQELEKRLTEQLRARELTDEDNQRLLDGIGRQHDKGRVTLFLRAPEIEPTNNRAERGLRPAVIARKVSQCSKNVRGAHTYEVLKTVFATLALRTPNVVSAFAAILRGEAGLPDACLKG